MDRAIWCFFLFLLLEVIACDGSELGPEFLFSQVETHVDDVDRMMEMHNLATQQANQTRGAAPMIKQEPQLSEVGSNPFGDGER